VNGHLLVEVVNIT